jgi:subtilase family serine protease
MRIARARALGTAAACSLLTVTALSSAPAARAADARVPVPDSHPSWAVPSALVSAPAVAAGEVDARVYLAGRDQPGLAAYAAAVSTPGNASYRHYLTPAQAMARFGPSGAQVTALRSWLSSAGLTVAKVSDAGPAGGYIAVHGPLSAAGKAFDVGFGIYRGPGGHRYRAPSRPATVPAQLASAVLSVTGLDTAPSQMMPQQPAPGPAGPAARICSHYYGQKVAKSEPPAGGAHRPWVLCGYRPQQLRGAYGVTASGMTGRGQTVAIVDAYRSPTMLADARRYNEVTANQQLRPGQYQQLGASRFVAGEPAKCDAPDWHVEESLDVEAVHASAPDARIRYVAARSCHDPDLAEALAVIVNQHLASIVSSSFGGPTGDDHLIAVSNSIFRLGAIEGIGFYFSSGDNGYNAPAENPDSSAMQVEFPTSSPYVTSVGGTSLAIGSTRNYRFETAWGTLKDLKARHGHHWQQRPPGKYPGGYVSSGGGGVSTVFRQPSWQKGVVPRALATRLPTGAISPAPMRVVPDVADIADPNTGFLVGRTARQPLGRRTYSLTPVGGTSLACPVFAAIEADAQQAAGHPFGFADPMIYARYGTPAFHDVTDHPLGPGHLYEVTRQHRGPSGPLTAVLVALGINGGGKASLPAVRGYDAATGVGSPARYIQSFLASARPQAAGAAR